MTHDLLLLRPEDLDAALVDAWQDLADRSPVGNVFHGPSVLLPALRHIAPAEVRLVVVREGERWMLAVPVEPRRSFYRHPVAAAQTFEHRQMPFGSPLAGIEAEDRHWAALLDGVAQLGSRWWVAHLLHDRHAASLEAAAARRGARSRRVLTHARAVARRREQDDHAERVLSGKRRRELRRGLRRLAEDLGGAAVVDLLADDAGRLTAAEVAERFLALEASGWKTPDGGAMVLDEAEAAFFRDTVVALHARGELQAWAVRGHDGTVPAMALLIHAGATFYWWKTAYDEAYAAAAPGVHLAVHSLSAFHDSGARTLDTCTIAGHRLAADLTEDTRTLTTLMVGLGSGLGDAAVRSAPRWHALRLRVDARLGRT